MTEEEKVSFDWWSWIAKQGIFAAMLTAAAVWFAQMIVLPMRDDQKRFMESVIDVNKRNSETQQQFGAILQNQSMTMTSMQELLRQIRDDQRKGVWKESQ